MLKRKKLLVVIISLLLSLSVSLSACTTNATSAVNPPVSTPASDSAVAPDDGNLNAPGTYPIAKKTIDMTVGILQHANVENFDTNTLTQYFKENVNMNINFEYFSNQGEGKEGLDKVQVMIAAKQTLPEVLIGFEPTDVQMQQLANQGAAIPLNDYIEPYGYNIKKAAADEPTLLNSMKSADGNIYYMPNFQDQIGNKWSLRAVINQKWLDTLNLPMPATTDEYYEVLKAFKTQDPNGNKKADEIPLLSRANGWRTDVYDFFINSFIYNDANHRYVVENGKLRFAYNQPEWQEAMRYLAMLCKEDLLAPESFILDGTQFKVIANQENASVLGSFTYGGLPFTADNENKIEYAALPPLKGPNGVSYSAYFPVIPTKQFIITPSCENPGAAFMWADFMMSEESTIRNRFGTPGINWEDAQAGDKGLFAVLNIPARLRITKDIWNDVQNEHWHEMGAAYRTSAISDGVVFTGSDLDSEFLISKFVLVNVGKEPAEYVVELPFTLEEMEAISESRTVIEEYVKQCIARFITGDLDVEKDWDNYLKDLKNMGIDEYLKISQNAYDRIEK